MHNVPVFSNLCEPHPKSLAYFMTSQLKVDTPSPWGNAHSPHTTVKPLLADTSGKQTPPKEHQDRQD